jgi:hypothetical protein
MRRLVSSPYALHPGVDRVGFALSCRVFAADSSRRSLRRSPPLRRIPRPLRPVLTTPGYRFVRSHHPSSETAVTTTRLADADATLDHRHPRDPGVRGLLHRLRAHQALLFQTLHSRPRPHLGSPLQRRRRRRVVLARMLPARRGQVEDPTGEGAPDSRGLAPRRIRREGAGNDCPRGRSVSGIQIRIGGPDSKVKDVRTDFVSAALCSEASDQVSSELSQRPRRRLQRSK